MENQFFARPILNSPYDYPARHWELDGTGQPTQKIVETRRRAEFTDWVPGVNSLKQHGRWAFAEFTDVFQMQDDFGKKVESEFEKMIDRVTCI